MYTLLGLEVLNRRALSWHRGRFILIMAESYITPREPRNARLKSIPSSIFLLALSHVWSGVGLLHEKAILPWMQDRLLS